MTALRWTRRTLDALLVVAVLAVALTAGITLLAPVLGGRALVIGGGSMEPAIGHGSLVLALPTQPDGHAVGDVVTVQQGASTPYTHRIVRLTSLDGAPYVETKGDANAQPDPAIVPAAAIIGTIAVSLPLLGYLSLILGTALGLAGFLALCATVLLLIWVLEDLEAQRCAECRAADAAIGQSRPLAPDGAPTRTAIAAGAATRASGATGAAHAASGFLAALPAFAVAGPPLRVRDSGRARHPGTPVLLEADRRNPHRHRVVTQPTVEAPMAPDGAHGERGVDVGDHRGGDLAA